MNCLLSSLEVHLAFISRSPAATASHGVNAAISSYGKRIDIALRPRFKAGVLSGHLVVVLQICGLARTVVTGW
jgi:hypothetical protein